MLRVLDLFSGIGGFSLGLERTKGFHTMAFCESNPYCQKVLKKHWGDISIYDDIKTLTGERLRADGIAVDVITGGWPCQDFSVAGKGAGLKGERSGLWWEFCRLIKEIKPQWVIAENVSALRSRGLDQILRSLFEIGYDAEWHCIPASAVGAPHQRDRIWIVAHASSEGLERGKLLRDDLEKAIARKKSATGTITERCPISGGTIYSWNFESNICRVAHGVPNRVDRLRALGNSLVPQISQLIGEAILAVAP